MLLHALAHGQYDTIITLFPKPRNIRRRRRRRRAENIFQNPFAANCRGGAIGIGRNRKNAALPQQAATGLIGQRDLAEMIPLNVRYLVMPRQPFIDERIVRREELE